VEAIPTNFGLVASTVTPGRGFPWLSTTFPVILPVGVSWPKAVPAAKPNEKNTTKAAMKIFFIMILLPNFYGVYKLVPIKKFVNRIIDKKQFRKIGNSV
jgi:hypothetical protein